MALVKRTIRSINTLQTELDARLHKVDDIVTDFSLVDGTATYDVKWVSANALRTKFNSKVDTSSIVDDLTTGGTTVPLSAEQGKALKLLIDGMSSGLIYRGIFDASGSVLPADSKKGDFYKVSVAGTVLGLELAVGDMIIANNDVVGDTAAEDWDKIDNTEAADILSTSNISTDPDFAIDGTKLADRDTIKTYVETFVESAVSAVNIKAINETVTLTGDTATLAYTPLSGVILMGTATIDNEDTTYDLVTCSVSGTTLTVQPLVSGEYTGKSCTVSYLYV